MRIGGEGLAHLSEQDLRNLLKAVHDGTLKCPVSQQTLVTAGLSYLIDKVDHLSGLDERAVRSVLVAVIAERRRAASPPRRE